VAHRRAQLTKRNHQTLNKINKILKYIAYNNSSVLSSTVSNVKCQ